MNERALLEIDAFERRVSPVVVFLPCILPLLAMAAGAPIGAMVATAMIALALGAYLYFGRALAANVPVRIGVTGDRLTVGDQTYPRAALREGLAVLAADAGRRRVRLYRQPWLPPLELDATRDDADRLLGALGLDAAHSTSQFWIGSPLFAFPWTIAIVLLVMFGVNMFAHALRHLPVNALPYLFIPLFLAYAAPARLTIGADGLVVNWLGFRRYIARAEIERVDTYFWGFRKSQGLELRLRSGTIVRVHVSQPRNVLGEVSERVRMIRERVVLALDAAPRSKTSPDLSVMLRASGRDARAWIDALGAIGVDGGATHRSAAIPREDLWRIAEDPAADVEARAAAAVALGAEEEARPRLRVLGGSIAAPQLRIAIDAVAEKDDAALEDAMSAIARENEDKISQE